MYQYLTILYWTHSKIISKSVPFHHSKCSHGAVFSNCASRVPFSYSTIFKLYQQNCAISMWTADPSLMFYVVLKWFLYHMNTVSRFAVNSLDFLTVI